MTTIISPQNVPEVDVVGGPAERRRHAVDEAVAETRSSRGPSDPDSREPAIAMRSYGQGCLALALAGSFDRAGVERLRALLPTLDRLAVDELVVDLSMLTGCDSALARVLGQLRIRRLTAGAQVELRSSPEALVLELGHTTARSYTVRDSPRSSGRRGRS